MFLTLVIPLLWSFCFGQHLSEEAFYIINGKRTINTVNEKYIGFSIDPVVLLTGLNLSDATLQMAKRLAPAYVRIAGPSTPYVKFEQENWNDGENGFVVVTPTMWFGINEWLASANLTPVFGINDGNMGRDGWNPQEAMDVLDLADKFNVSGYWELGYDCSNKSQGQYEMDLRRLQHVLDAFPEKKDIWKIVGSDFRKCVTNQKRVLDDLSDVLAAVVLELNSTNELPPTHTVPMWASIPKACHVVSFASALSWAKELGEAAKNGYEVILRQPRLHEMYFETPTFWISLLHKMLMGRHVLDVKPTTLHPQVSLFAHCAKHQNDFIRSGAMTVLVVNNGTTNHTVFLKFGTAFLKNAEVRSYILTSDAEDATDIFLNGDKLSLSKYPEEKSIVPKLRRAKVMNYLSLFLPPKSVGFFVLPGAQIPVCANEDEDLTLLMEEINQDQNISFFDEVRVEVSPRFSVHRSPTLLELKQLLEKELQSDEKYYKIKMRKNHDDTVGRSLHFQRNKQREEDMKRRDDLKKAVLKHEFDLKHNNHYKEEEAKKVFELELTSAEIRKVLADRAKVKAAKKNIIFTSEELEDLMDKATKKFLNNKNASIRIRKRTRRDVARDKKDINMRLLKLKSLGDRRRLLRESLKSRKGKLETKREKRDINMELLKLKTEVLQKNNKNKKQKKFENYEEKQATIRGSGESSGEVVKLEEEEEEEEKESFLPDKDVFAELAELDEFDLSEKPKKMKIESRIQVEGVDLEPKNVVDDLSVSSVEEGYFDCIHEFSTRDRDKYEGKVLKNSSELWEINLETKKELKNNLPSSKIPKVQTEKGKLNFEKNFEDGMLFMEDDYGELDSDESNPLRLKRNIQDLSSGKVYFVLLKSHDPTKRKIDENLKAQQFKMLKDRLAQKKKLYFINRNHHRESRSLSAKKSFNERYKSLTENLQEWKPFDILTLKNPNKKRPTRSVSHDIDSVENEIGNFMNELMKDPNMIKPKLDKENGDYQLIFPNKDKIQVVENKGDTEVKLVLHEDSDVPKTNIQKVSKKYPRNIWDEMFGKLSKFFQGLSAKLKKCIMEDLLN